ncbi:hypothetical protein B1R32_1374 [Abditibacterium utsteinense]|uniref:Uncharacterized protein n=1 Tax=Abditibacterium utsteinense TaxID=1960156 RepID=A0A2S8SNQ6_9BACT|nr:hypothetical protein B1R32_1374 [Abditibacterium utsteinense]
MWRHKEATGKTTRNPLARSLPESSGGDKWGTALFFWPKEIQFLRFPKIYRPPYRLPLIGFIEPKMAPADDWTIKRHLLK